VRAIVEREKNDKRSGAQPQGVVREDLGAWTWDELEAEIDRLETEVRRRALVAGAVSQRVASSLLGAVDTELRRPVTDAIIRRAGFDPTELRDGELDIWLPWERYVQLVGAFEGHLTEAQAHRAGAAILSSRWLRFLLQSARGFTDLEVSLRWANRVVFGPGSLAFRGCEATLRRLTGGSLQLRYAPPRGSTFPALWLPLTRGAVGRFADLVGGRGERTAVERDGATLLVRVERAPGPTGYVKALLRAGLGAGALQDARAELRLRNRELQRRLEELEAAERGRERLMLRLSSRREQEAVARLAGGVAHDLNNLLTAMRMQLDMLRLTFADDRAAMREIEWMTDAVVKSAGRARELLDLRRHLDAQGVAVDELELRGLGAGNRTMGGSTRHALVAQVEALRAHLGSSPHGTLEPAASPTTAQVSWRNVSATLAAAERIGVAREDVVAALSWTFQEDTAPATWVPWSHFNELLERLEELAGEEGLRSLGAQALHSPLFTAIGAATGAFLDEADLFDWILRFVFGPESSYFVGLPGHLEVHGLREVRVVWESRGAPIVRALACALAGIVEHTPRLVGRPPASVSFAFTRDRIEVDARLAPRRAVARVLSHLAGRTRGTREAQELRRVYMNLVERNQHLLDKLVELEQTRRHRKLLERRLEQIRPMEVTSHVAASVAHDFNNALTVIRGHAALLQMHLADDPRRQDLDLVFEAAAQATTLTQKLRVIGGGEPEACPSLDVGQHLDALVPFLQSAVGEQTRVVVRQPQGLRCGATIRGAELERILLNLVKNARDADATQVVVELREVTLDADFVREHPGAEPGPHVLLAVQDDGQGMPGEVKTRAFEPYFSTKDHGTGVGLATVFGMVHSVGGTIWVDSEPGEGCCFRIYIPAAPTPPAESDPPPSFPARPSSEPTASAVEQLLVIDDDDMLRAILARLIVSGGYEVTTASSGDDAMALVRQGCRPALVVSDVVMPGLRGQALVEALRAELGPVPILFVSGFSDVPLALGPGMDFLPKPFTRENLLSRLAALLQAKP